MTLKGFLKYVEIQTKVASMFPFALGTLYSIYRFHSFKLLNFVIMLVSLLCFDMATTAINNYIDNKKSYKTKDKNNPEHRIIQGSGISTTTGLTIIFMLLIMAVLAGITLTIRTSVLVLAIGIISFFTGIIYTFGPIPISRTPFGEIFSGFFMGFIILFLAVYIHIYDKNIITLMYTNGILTFNANIKELLYIFLFSVPVIGGIANIMLANNTCDVEEDIKNNRFTLPYYLGKKNSLRLFKWLYYAGYLDIVLLVLLGAAPIAYLVVLLTALPVNKAIKKFYEKQKKSETFILSVRNFIIMSGSQVIIMVVSIVVKNLLKI